MSYDPQAENKVDYPNYEGMAPKESGSRKWWLIGGCGCLFAVVLCCGGTIGGGYFYVYLPLDGFLMEQIGIAETSDLAAEKLGGDVRVDQNARYNEVEQESNQTARFSIPIRGAEKEGRLIIRTSFQNGVWQLDSMVLDVDGEQIPMDEDPLELDIEGMDDL